MGNISYYSEIYSKSLSNGKEKHLTVDGEFNRTLVLLLLTMTAHHNN